jgi:regulator of protease activity HflC (stomatin/prohibitin superfamily)
MKKFKKMGLLLILIVFVFSFTSCSLVGVNADEEGVFVKKPWFFGSGGVDPTPLTEGSTWIVTTTDFVKFTMTPTQYDEKFDDIMSSDNTPVDLSAHVLIKIVNGKTPYLLQHFGVNWYKNNIEKTFCNDIRNEISKYPMMELTSKRSIYDSLRLRIINILEARIKKIGLPIEIEDVVIDKATPNAEVMEEYNKTAAKIQAKQTQKSAAEMEIARKYAEEMRAQADKAYQTTMNLTSAQFIQLKSIDVEKDKVEMIRNKSNVNVSLFMGSGATPIYNVK